MSDDPDGDVVEEERPADEEGDHLDEIPTGAGCTEIWEKLSEQREAAAETETVEE